MTDLASPSAARRRSSSDEVMFKQIGMRLSVEFFAFMVACLVGALGGWIYVLVRSRGGTSDAASTTD